MTDTPSIKDAYTTQEMADILELDAHSSVARRAKREGWQSRVRPIRGGGYEWLVSSMPQDTRMVLAARVVKVNVAPVTAEAQTGLARTVALTDKARVRAEARSTVLLLYRIFAANTELLRTQALEMFCIKWNAGEIEAEPAVRAALPRVCRNSLVNWEKRVAAAGISALAGNRGGHSKGTGCIDGQVEVRETVLGTLHKHPGTSVVLILEALQAMNHKREKKNLSELRLPSLRLLQEWVQRWKIENPQVYSFIRNPDKWRSQFLISCGRAYELIVRYNQRWEYDGTPADLLLADGQRYTIVGIINVFSREVKLEVALRSSARVVANVTRRALLDWGVPEEAVTDNGKEFVATHMQQIFLGLGIYPNILPPFRPDLKSSIERVFRTFSHHLLTLQEGYVGHNVATRQEIRERKTFAKRLRDKDETIELAMTPEQLQLFCDNWADKVYRHRPHKGLHGKTPFEVRQAWEGEVRRITDERALDMLLVRLEKPRKVGKEGVRAVHGQYMHTALATMTGEYVQVRLAPEDRFSAYIFTEDGEFVCKAVRINDLAPEERQQLAVNARREQAAFVKAGERSLRGMAKRTHADTTAERIMEMHIDKAARIEAEAAARSIETVTHTTDTLAQCGVASRADESKAPMAHAEAIQAAREAGRAALAASVPHWMPEDDMGKVRLYGSLLALAGRGESIPADQISWMYEFEKTSVYEAFAGMRGWERLDKAVGQ